MRQHASICWYRDFALAIVLACGIVFLGWLATALLGLGNGATPARASSTTAEAPLACRVDGTIGQDGNTASAVANHLAGRRGTEALQIMQSEGNGALDLVHPGQTLSVPVPC